MFECQNEELCEQLVPKLRKAVVDTYENDAQAFDETDYQNVMSEDWFPRRFLLQESFDEKIATEKLIDALKWRKANNLRFVEDNHFPADFYEIGALFIYKEDKNNRPTIYLRIKFIRKVPELRDIFKQFLVHTVYKIDEQANRNGYTLILDFKNASLKNCDLDLVSFFINTLKNYFPYGVQCILVNELPWILTAFWKLVETWIPDNAKELIKCTKYSTLRDHFDEYNLPDFTGGCCPQDYRDVPLGCLDGEEFGTQKLGIPRSDVRKIMQKYRVLLSA